MIEMCSHTQRNRKPLEHFKHMMCLTYQLKITHVQLNLSVKTQSCLFADALSFCRICRLGTCQEAGPAGAKKSLT